MQITKYLKAEKDVNGNWVLTRDTWQIGYRFINLILKERCCDDKQTMANKRDAKYE